MRVDGIVHAALLAVNRPHATTSRRGAARLWTTADRPKRTPGSRLGMSSSSFTGMSPDAPVDRQPVVKIGDDGSVGRTGPVAEATEAARASAAPVGSNFRVESLDVETTVESEPFQPDMRRGWRNIAVYWAIGASVGLQGGYFADLVASVPTELSRILAEPLLADRTTSLEPSLSLAFIVAACVTVLSRHRLDRRYTGHGRSVDWPSILLFASANSVFETVLFLTSYDSGKSVVLNTFGSEAAVPAVAAGIATFFAYSGLVHALFWLPKAFPHHTVKRKDEPFHTHALPYLAAISLVWVWLYESHTAIGTVCALHFLVDTWAGHTMRLPGPWNPQADANSNDRAVAVANDDHC